MPSDGKLNFCRMSKQRLYKPNHDHDDGPGAPLPGQVFADRDGCLWRVSKVSFAPSPSGFYILHLQFSKSQSEFKESMVVGPREWGILIRDRELRLHLRSV